MANANKPWWEWEATRTKYIETPIKLFYGGYDKVVYPHILAVVIVGAFLVMMLI